MEGGRKRGSRRARAHLVEEAACRRVSAGGGKMQRGAAVGVLAVDVEAAPLQHARELPEVAARRGGVQPLQLVGRGGGEEARAVVVAAAERRVVRCEELLVLLRP